MNCTLPKFLCAVVLLLLGTGCQWNLDEAEFPTYNRLQGGLSTANGKLKRGVLPLAQGRFLTGGTAPDGRMQLTTWESEGTFLPVLVDLPPGTVHDILPLGAGDTTFLVLGTDETQTFLYRVRLGDEPLATRRDRLNSDVEDRVGFLQSLQLYDMERGPEDTYLLTGTVQQTIGDPRLALVELDAAFNVTQVQLFELNVTGYRVLPYGDSQVLIASLTANDQLNIRQLERVSLQTWQTDISGSRFPRIPSMTLALERNAVIVPATRDGGGGPDPYLVFIDLTTGKEQDAVAVRLPDGGEDAHFIDRLRSGDLLLGGVETPRDPSSGRRYFLTAVDTLGNVRWHWSPGDELARTMPGLPISGGQSADFGTYLFAVESQQVDTVEAQRILKLDEVGELIGNF